MPRTPAPRRSRNDGPRSRDHAAQRSSFSERVVRQLADDASQRARTPGEDLAHLDYEAELELKNAALAAFWSRNRLAPAPEPLIASPRPRGYRTTSKRRVAVLGGKAILFLGDRKAHRDQPVFVESPLEPDEHAAVFRFLQAKLSEPTFRIVAEHLSWIIIRGSYSERAVILNVDSLFGPLVRKLKMLARQLAACDPPVTAAFVYVDETGSDYYLEARRPSKTAVDFKRLFGPEVLRVSYDDLRLGFHPTSFSQVNESIVPQMLRLARRLLAPSESDRLIDLYCGYGLFSHALGGRVAEVVGMDAAEPSIEAARENGRRLRRHGYRFLANRITAASMERLPAPTRSEIVILDPPRNGTERGVIAAIAARGPRRVLHVFCSVDEIPAALREWKSGGYKPERVIPLDMFAGTPHVEVLIALGATARQPRHDASVA